MPPKMFEISPLPRVRPLRGWVSDPSPRGRMSTLPARRVGRRRLLFRGVTELCCVEGAVRDAAVRLLTVRLL